MSGSARPPLSGAHRVVAPDPGDPAWSEWVESQALSPAGVDRSQIWASFRRTPDERLAVLERAVADLLELRDGAWPEIR